MLAKLIDGAISYAQRKIIIDGKTIFNPSENLLKEQGYKDVETTEAPAVPTRTQQAVSNWQEQEDKIVQSWDIVPAQPDPTAVLQEIQKQAVLTQIAESEDKTLGIQCTMLLVMCGPILILDIRTNVLSHMIVSQIPETIGQLKTGPFGRRGIPVKKSMHFRGRNRKPGHLEYITLVNI